MRTSQPCAQVRKSMASELYRSRKLHIIIRALSEEDWGRGREPARLFQHGSFCAHAKFYEFSRRSGWISLARKETIRRRFFCTRGRRFWGLVSVLRGYGEEEEAVECCCEPYNKHHGQAKACLRRRRRRPWMSAKMRNPTNPARRFRDFILAFRSGDEPDTWHDDGGFSRLEYVCGG